MKKTTYKILVIFTLLSMNTMSMAENSSNISVAEKFSNVIESICNKGAQAIVACGTNYISKKICNRFILVISACSIIYAQDTTIDGVTIAQNINKSKKYAYLINRIEYANTLNNPYAQAKYWATPERNAWSGNQFDPYYSKHYREGMNAWHSLGLGTVGK